MKFCVFGAGAIGGYLAVELAAGGSRSLYHRARRASSGHTRNAASSCMIQGREKVARIAAADDPRAFGIQDLVICALKAHQAYDGRGSFAPLLGPETAFLTAMNGIPWWYFYTSGGRFEGHHLDSVDPAAANGIHPAKPGDRLRGRARVRSERAGSHRASRFNRFIIGEPDGSRSSRVQDIERGADPRQASMRRCATIFAGISGSSSGAMSASIRSACSPVRRLTASSASLSCGPV